VREGWEGDLLTCEEALIDSLPCYSLPRCDSCRDLTASSICFLIWMHSSVLVAILAGPSFLIGLPRRKAIVTLIISSTDLGMLSFSLLIKSGLVMPCMNPDIRMHSGASLTCILFALNHSMKASVHSPSILFNVMNFYGVLDVFILL
ncbi:hypothetical protein Tco_1241878, partial [Tanacetum coccineum]